MDQTSQEHGIGVVQLIAAEQRQREEGGIYRQHRWSVAHLNERIIAFFALWLVVLSVLVGLLVDPLAGAGLGAAAVVAAMALRTWRARRLAALREAQVADRRRMHR